MTLTILNQSSVDSLKGNLKLAGGLDKYGAAEFDLTGASFLASPIDVGRTPDLVMEKPDQGTVAGTDFDNAKRVYDWLGPLEEIVATDTRLWITLTHRDLFGYVHWRWPPKLENLDDPKKRASSENHVVAHWFFKGGGLAGMRRNGVARLWWAAHLTHRPWAKDEELSALRTDDDYEYTRVLLSNQDVYQGLIEREFAVNRRVLCAILAVIRKDEKTRCTSAYVTRLWVELNLLSRWRELPAIPVVDLVAQLEARAG